MVKLHFLWLCWGPVLFCFSVAWLIVHPTDWTGPAVLGPLSALYGLATYRYAFRLLDRGTDHRLPLIVAMGAGPLLGLVLAGMIVVGVIG